ncbi:MAG: hypothetical protein AAGD32_06945 [Planctomycetota bacterium]
MDRFHTRVVVLLALLGGCATATEPVAMNDGPYLGPTLEPAALIAELRARAESLPTLWANGTFEAEFVSPDRTDFVNGSLVVQHRKPGDLRVLGDKAGQRVFDVGLNADTYWALVKGGTDTLWYGAIDGIDAVDQRALPVRPDQLADVFGLAGFDADLLAEPFPVVRFNPDDDVYMVTWHERRDDLPGGSRVVAVREVWYDRATLLPRYVHLFDPQGRVIVRGDLSDHTEVTDAGGTRLARRYDLFFPETGSVMQLTLGQLRLRRGRFPIARSFAAPDPARPGVGNVVNLDDAPLNAGGVR